MRFKIVLPVLLAISIIIVASLACNFPGQNSQQPLEAIPVSTEAVDSLAKDILIAAQELQTTGRASLDISEAELTSVVAFELQSQETPIMLDPQIYLRDGEILLVGNVLQSERLVPVQVVFIAEPDAKGNPDFEIVSANIGVLPLPQSTVQQFSKELNAAFASTIEPRIQDIFVESIVIANGVMTIQGHTR